MQRGTTFKNKVDAPAAGVEKASQCGKDEHLVADGRTARRRIPASIGPINDVGSYNGVYDKACRARGQSFY
jgi:hypothetical protein